MRVPMILRPTNPRVIAPGAGSSIDRFIDTALSISAISREVGDKYMRRTHYSQVCTRLVWSRDLFIDLCITGMIQDRTEWKRREKDLVLIFRRTADIARYVCCVNKILFSYFRIRVSVLSSFFLLRTVRSLIFLIFDPGSIRRIDWCDGGGGG